ncbi:MAG: hypothetical protein IH841_03130 [Thaumarchaeota archaeon]|nr:hypothetical protein [Nitrososphaerota archaeon]
MKSKPPKLAIFDTYKTKSQKPTGEAIRQRFIIITLATQTNPIEKTRISISKSIANESQTIWKNLYSGIFLDLDQVLIPLGLVEEAGRLPLKRGPKALQEKGIPYYKLTKSGLLVSLSLKELKNQQNILEQFFSNASSEEKEFQEIIQKLSKIAPKFTHSLFEKYIRSYCNGKLKNLMPMNLENLKIVNDESLQVQKEFLKAFSHLSKPDMEKTVNLLNRIC